MSPIPAGIEALAQETVKLGHHSVLFTALSPLVVFHRRTPAVTTACFVFFAMFANTLLKHTFKVPLFPHLGKGYAFPSGHMHIGCVFHGSLVLHFRNRFVILICSIMVIIEGISLYVCRFHDVKDLMGAIIVAAVELGVFDLLKSRVRLGLLSLIVHLANIIMMLMLQILHTVEPHIWIAFYGYSGCLIAVFLFREIKIHHLFMQILTLFLIFILSELDLYLFRSLQLTQAKFRELRFFFSPIIIIGTTYLIGRISPKPDLLQPKTE
jgi:undecaprenyl-diphosphatase